VFAVIIHHWVVLGQKDAVQKGGGIFWNEKGFSSVQVCNEKADFARSSYGVSSFYVVASPGHRLVPLRWIYLVGLT